MQESELQAFPNFRLKLEQCVGLLVKDKSARVGIALRLVLSVPKSKLCASDRRCIRLRRISGHSAYIKAFDSAVWFLVLCSSRSSPSKKSDISFVSTSKRTRSPSAVRSLARSFFCPGQIGSESYPWPLVFRQQRSRRSQARSNSSMSCSRI